MATHLFKQSRNIIMSNDNLLAFSSCLKMFDKASKISVKQMLFDLFRASDFCISSLFFLTCFFHIVDGLKST